jgi:hypothetical protein
MKTLSHEAPTTQGQHGLRVYDDGAVWITFIAIDVQLRICIAAHCGSSGHRRKSAIKMLNGRRVPLFCRHSSQSR